MSPVVSVILPTYSRGNSGLLKRAIDSVLNQVFRDFELIIVDDGSRDATQQVVKSYRDPRIRYIRHEDHCGIPARRVNEGIRMARAEIIAFQFDDDVWLPYHLEAAVAHLNKLGPEYGMVFGLTRSIHSMTHKEVVIGLNFSPITMRSYNSIGNQSAVMRKRTLIRVGGYDEDLGMRRYCDWDLWRRVLDAGFKIYKIPEITTLNYYAQHDSIGLNVPVDEAYVRRRMAENRSYYLRSLILPFDVRHLLSPEIRRQGQLVKGDKTSAVYFLMYGLKHVFPNRDVFTRLGFQWGEIRVLPQNQIDNIPDGLVMRV